MECLEFIAFAECPSLYGSNGIWQRDGGKFRASIECIIVNACYVVGKTSVLYGRRYYNVTFVLLGLLVRSTLVGDLCLFLAFVNVVIDTVNTCLC